MKYYMAYGSNMNIEQMAHRCPDAKVVCSGTLKGWELVFRGSANSAVATIEKKVGHSVPVVFWTISESDERELDVYEGYPHFYTKKMVTFTAPSGERHCAMVYVMTPNKRIGVPSERYFGIIADGYRKFGFDVNSLSLAAYGVSESDVGQMYDKLDRIAESQADSVDLICPRCGNPMDERLHKNALSRRCSVYICSRCGIEEAICDMNRTPDPISEWYVFDKNEA